MSSSWPQRGVSAIDGDGSRCLALGSLLAAGLSTCVASEEAPNREIAFQCAGGEQFVAVFEPDLDSVVVRVHGESARLPHVPAASGAKYGDGRTIFWSKGDEALLERPGETWRDCVGRAIRPSA